jgi:hypothetical protein
MNSYRRPSLLGPIVLVGLGLLLLLQNLDYLPNGAWSTVWRLWPALLIVLGLDLWLGRRSALGALLGLGLAIAFVGGALLWAFRAPPFGPAPEAVSLRQPLDDVERAAVRLDFGSGRLQVAASDDDGALVAGTAAGARETYTVTPGVAHWELTQRTAPPFYVPFAIDFSSVDWDIGLAPGLPLDLSITSRTGEARIDLGGLDVSRLDLETGLSTVSVTFPDHGRIQADISGGAGEVVISIPPDLPARITVSNGITDMSVPARFVRRDSIYETPGFSTDGDYLDLDLSLGIGSVVVK